jgi:adenylate kinase family enzyme
MIFLIGRHGSGKSTIGSALAARGYLHLSIGLLRRLARSGSYPTDIPAVLLAAIGRSKPGAPLPLEVANRLLVFANSSPLVVIDGFPASIDHISILPSDSLIGLVSTRKRARISRLMHRAAISQRQWIEGRESSREEALPTVIRSARKLHNVKLIRNNHHDTSHIDTIVDSLINAD